MEKKSNVSLAILAQTEYFFTHSFFYYEFLNFEKNYLRLKYVLFKIIKKIITNDHQSLQNENFLIIHVVSFYTKSKDDIDKRKLCIRTIVFNDIENHFIQFKYFFHIFTKI